jgi:hypothetical protein
MRKYLWLLALIGLFSYGALAGSVTTVPITQGSGTNFQVISNNANNFFAEMGICDAAGTGNCATVLAGSTAATTASLPLVVAISPINSVIISGSTPANLLGIVSLSSPNIQIVGIIPLPTNAAQETGGNLALLATTVSHGSLQTVLSGTVAATQSGVWNITNITGTITLPTNAAQETGGNLASLATTVNKTSLNVLVSSTATVSLSSPNILASITNVPTVIVSGATPPNLLGIVSLSSPNIQLSGAALTALTAISASVASAIPAGANVIGYVTPDPCSQIAKTNVNISQNASTQIIAGTSAKKTYICSAILLTDNGVANAGQLSLVEGTGTVCASATGAIIGGTTSGMNLSPSSGFAQGTGLGTVIPVLSASADNVCLLGSVIVHGNMTYVQQ